VCALCPPHNTECGTPTPPLFCLQPVASVAVTCPSDGKPIVSDASGQPLTFSVRLSIAALADTTVTFQLSGTASCGTNFTVNSTTDFAFDCAAAKGSLVIPMGELGVAPILITPIPDSAAAGGDGTVVFTIGNPFDPSAPQLDLYRLAINNAGATATGTIVSTQPGWVSKGRA
jgi:hypothetical protein